MTINNRVGKRCGRFYHYPRLLVIALAVCVGCLLDVNVVSAAEDIANQAQNNQVQIK